MFTERHQSLETEPCMKPSTKPRSITNDWTTHRHDGEEPTCHRSLVQIPMNVGPTERNCYPQNETTGNMKILIFIYPNPNSSQVSYLFIPRHFRHRHPCNWALELQGLSSLSDAGSRHISKWGRWDQGPNSQKLSPMYNLGLPKFFA